MQLAVMQAAVPIGTIVMWNGAVTTLPCGWAIVDDLKGRFPVGAGDGSGYDIGATGGENGHVLTVDEMPKHNHGMWLKNSGTRFTGGGSASALNDSDIADGTPTGDTGKGIAHENRPPYYAVYFIKKTSNCKNSYEQ
jgi:microcystin-dependent protein